MSHADYSPIQPLKRPGIVVLVAAALALFLVACSQEPERFETVVVPDPTVATTSEVKSIALASVLVTEETEERAPTVDRIEISPASIVLDPGETVSLTARALALDGTEIGDVQLIWTAPDSRAGAISSEGTFQAGSAPGVYDSSVSVTAIQNTFEGVTYTSAQVSVTIVGDAVLSKLVWIEIIPDRPTVLRQQIYRLRAVGFDENGVVIPGVSFEWTLNDDSLGRLNKIGLLTVNGVGGEYRKVVSVTGAWAGRQVSNVADVRVISAPEEDDYLNVHALPQRFFIEPGERLRLRAVALNGLGKIQTGTVLRWGMVDERAGVIDGEGNFIAGNVPGIYTEAVRVEAVVPGEDGFARTEDFASVVVRDIGIKRLDSLAVFPGTVIAAPGGKANLFVRTMDSSGNPAEAGITWEVLDKSVGTVDEGGIFTAGTIPGVYKVAIRATAEQQDGDETIVRTGSVDIVITGTLSNSEVSPSLATIAPGRLAHFRITGWDEHEIALPGLVVRWTVTDTNAGTVDLFGNFRAGNIPGMYRDVIRAEVIQIKPPSR